MPQNYLQLTVNVVEFGKIKISSLYRFSYVSSDMKTFTYFHLYQLQICYQLKQTCNQLVGWYTNDGYGFCNIGYISTLHG